MEILDKNLHVFIEHHCRYLKLNDVFRCLKLDDVDCKKIMSDGVEPFENDPKG